MKFHPDHGGNGTAEPPVLRSDSPVTLVGGGPVDPAQLAGALGIAPLLVAADGGAVRALAAGHVPDAVIGDMDSFDPDAHSAIASDCVFAVTEQDSTDFDKALRHIRAPLVLALGVMGGRIDHELAAFHTLIRRPSPPCILLGAEDIVLHVARGITLDLPADTRVSLFPMRPVTARLSGLRWSFDRIALAPDDRIGTSNAALGGAVELGFDGPGTLLILPRACLGAVRSSRWPAPDPRAAPII